MLPRYFLPSLKSTGLSVQEKFKTDFQDGGHPGFRITMTLAIFDLLVTQMPQIKLWVNLSHSLGATVEYVKS